MADELSSENGVFARSHRLRAAARTLGIAVAVLVAYACWRGYQSPDFLIGVGAAFGLC